jgi:hypothetical protein
VLLGDPADATTQKAQKVVGGRAVTGQSLAAFFG